MTPRDVDVTNRPNMQARRMDEVWQKRVESAARDSARRALFLRVLAYLALACIAFSLLGVAARQGWLEDNTLYSVDFGGKK